MYGVFVITIAVWSEDLVCKAGWKKLRLRRMANEDIMGKSNA